MAEYSMTKTFKLPADQVWAFASDAANLSRWLPTTQRSSAEEPGDVRLAGESHGHAYDMTASLRGDAQGQRLSWAAPDLPGYEGSLDISGGDGHCELTVHLRVPDDHAAAAQTEEVERGMAEALDGLADGASR